MTQPELTALPDVSQKDPYWVAALSQGLAVLRAFDNAPHGLNLTEIAQRLGWSRTKPYRYIHTLEKMGYLSRDDASKRYRPTSLTMTLGYAYFSGLSLIELAQPELDRLRDAVKATVHLGILEQGQVVYVAGARMSIMPAVDIHIGSRVSPLATSIGRALLAYLDDARRDPLIGTGPLPALTPQSITDPVAFRRMLQRIHQQGHALTDEEFHLGIRSVAAPIFDQQGQVVAAVNATSTVHYFSDAFLENTVIPHVKQAGAEISRSLGYRA